MPSTTSSIAPDRAIVLTPPGSAAIAVVRLCGPGVQAFLAARFSRPAAAGRCVHGDLRDGERTIDDAVVILSADGRAADVNVHGGPWVVRAVLELAQRDGFRVIECGLPLPDEAVEAESPLEREVLAYLPMARTQLALRMLLAQPEAWAHLETELPAVAPDERRRRIDTILADRSLHWLLHAPRVAIVGAANVGKSTLANQLFAQERSITADLPGTTRDWVGEMADLDGLAVMLVDTPGMRATLDLIEMAAIAQSREQVASADLVVVVLDASAPLDEAQRALIDAHPNALRVANKSDLPCAWSITDAGAMATVATTGEGIDNVRQAIRARFGCESPAVDVPRCWTERQREVLGRVKSPAGAP